MWDATIEVLNGGRVRRYTPRRSGRPIPYADVLEAWQHDQAYRSFFMSLLSAAPFAAFRWEAPPVTAATAGRDFEFALLDAPGLSAQADPAAFAAHLGPSGPGAGPADGVVAFANLGGDAVLVVPRPAGPAAAYAHLAAFARHAPAAQQHALWQAVGRRMAARLGPAPVWVSTAGMGVPWLHVRLDDRPKYYGFAPYAAAVAHDLV